MDVRSVVVSAVLWTFAVFTLVLGVWQLVSPGSFFDAVGPFGVRNDHYTRDAATFELANATLLLAAIRRPDWRVAALLFTAVRFGLHGVNHLVDIGDADPGWVGVFDAVALLVAFGWLAVALVFSRERSV